MPKGIGPLSRLCIVKGFVVGCSQRHEVCQLGELSSLGHLIKLNIDIRRGDSVLEDGEFNKLSSLTFWYHSKSPAQGASHRPATGIALHCQGLDSE